MSDLYLLKTDSLGELEWDRAFGGVWSDCGYCVEQTYDGGYVIVGVTRSFGAGKDDVYLVKTDANGLTGIDQTVYPVPDIPFELLQNSPNPLHHSTTIFYSLPEASEITLSIFDMFCESTSIEVIYVKDSIHFLLRHSYASAPSLNSIHR